MKKKKDLDLIFSYLICLGKTIAKMANSKEHSKANLFPSHLRVWKSGPIPTQTVANHCPIHISLVMLSGPILWYDNWLIALDCLNFLTKLKYCFYHIKQDPLLRGYV